MREPRIRRLRGHDSPASDQMERFWDQRAREHAAYFIDNSLDYRQSDMDRFWADGPGVVDLILERLGVCLRARDEVVEIGCGIGRLTRVLAARAQRVTAFDVSSEMLRKAAECNAEIDNVDWVHGDGVSLSPLADASADACFSYVVFQHLPDPALTIGYVREMGRVLRAGGWSAFQISNDPAIHRPNAGLPDHVRAYLGRGPRGQSAPAWVGSAVDLRRLEEVAKDAGMTVEAVDGAGSQFCLVLLRRQAAGP